MLRSVIVVPCYNESARLDAGAFERFAARTPEVDFLFVNDGSRDATLELLESLQARNPRRFAVLDLKLNGGKAEAVRQGLRMSLESPPDLVGFWDADLATPLDEIPAFAAVLERRPEVDLVVGCRMPLLGRTIERQPLRRLLGRVFANVASCALRIPIYDTQCGAKLFRTTPVLRSVLDEPFCTRWIFDVELLARIKSARRQNALPSLAASSWEQPLDTWRDVAGSKLKKGDFVKAILEMSRIYWRYLRPGADWSAPPAVVPVPRRRAA
jgi:glycosyltransferase involved in cell wall biosynthesis